MQRLVSLVMLFTSLLCLAGSKKKSEVVIPLPESDTTMVVTKSTVLEFSHRVFPSAGYNYIVVYKNKEFTAKADTQHLVLEEKDLPREMQRRPGPGRRPPKRMMGADAALKTVRLQPKKKGTYTFTVVVAERRKETTYTYSVEVK